MSAPRSPTAGGPSKVPRPMPEEPASASPNWARVYVITVAWGVLCIAALWVFTAAFTY
jgi:hypothetical protein